MKLMCGNRLCIYESDGFCTLEQIELDGSGHCVDCVNTYIEEEILEESKEYTRENIYSRYEEIHISKTEFD